MKITDDVYALESTRGSYAYLIRGPIVMLIDTGIPGKGTAILEELGTMGIHPQDIRHILLTHHDVDHIGNVAYLQRKTPAQVWASAVDLPYILGQKKRPGLKWLAAQILRTETPLQITPYPAEDRVEDIRVLHTPGHTPGHVCLLYKDVLLAGDIVSSRRGKLKISSATKASDHPRMIESARHLTEIPFRWICPAHGVPLERGDLWEPLFV